MVLLRILNNIPASKSLATVAQVSFSGGSGFGAVTSAEARGIPVFSPRGVKYRPCEGDRLLIMLVDGVETCVGCLSTGDAVESGELELASSGGAVIKLKNNGEISLNGAVITKDGKIIPKGGTAL